MFLLMQAQAQSPVGATFTTTASKTSPSSLELNPVDTSAPETAATTDASTASADTTAASPAANTGNKPVVLSFVEWKSLRVHEAQQKLEQKAQAQVNKQGQHVEEKSAQKLNFNVDVALQLNIQDYFSMYLKTLSKEEFKEATKKMNQDEVTDLLMAYKSSQDTAKGPALKFSNSEKR